MEKRSEIRKQEKQAKKEKLKCAFCIILCIALFIVSIYVTDSSINELLMDESDKKAIGLKLYENTVIVELAGEKYEIDVKRMKDGLSAADKYVKKYYYKLKDYIYSKI